jgi:hypothetical protein
MPVPHESVTISLDDYSMHAVGAQVFWFVDDAEQAESKDARSITINAGALGVKTSVRATIVRADDSRASASIVIMPAVVDLVLEADTYVPSFYKGRALPSRTSTLHATAVVNDGGALPDTAYTYRWTVGEEVLFGGPVRGKNSVSFPIPLYSKELTVEVISPEGSTIARKSMTLQSVQPELYFYEWSPLKGLYQKTVSDPFALIGNETTVYGEPYFVNAAPTNVNADVTWTIDRQVVPSDPDALRALTITPDLIGQGASVALRILTKDRVPQLVERSVTMSSTP